MKRIAKHAIPVLMTVLIGMTVLVLSCADDERITIYDKNPRYWQYRGRPVLLLGGSDEDNLFNNPALMMRNLDTLAAVGGNYIRSTLSCRDEGNVWPYEKRGGLYDLDSFNPEFWNRLETSFREAGKRGIIVQIEFWATFDYYRDNWLVNPFNPKNNSSYTTDNTRLETEWDFHPARKPQEFFFSVPACNNDTMLLSYQEAFVRKVLEVSLPYGNVLYALDNETRAPEEWAVYWGGFIRGECEKLGVNIHLTEMWDQWDITHEDHRRTYGHPEVFSFTDISQNNWQEGQTHYDRLIWYRHNLASQPGGIRPMNNVKVYARLSGDRPNDYGIGIDRWWQNIFAGCASTRFHRPESGSGLDDDAQMMIGGARTFTDAFDIFSCESRIDLMGERDDNEAYCLAGDDGIYALYFPDGGTVVMKPREKVADWRIRWFDVETAEFASPETPDAIPGGGLVIDTPSDGKIWLALVEPAG